MKKYVCLLLGLLWASISFATPPKHLTLILDWYLNPDHAPIAVAEQKGYFKQQGLDVHVIAPANPNDGPKMVAAGKADITITYLAGLIQFVENGLPLIRVGTLFSTNLNAMAVLKNGPIKTIKDLKGKTIGTSASSVDQAMVGAMLAHNGLSIKDVKMVSVQYNLVQALLAHRVDAISGIMRNIEPVEMRLAGQPARLFLPQNNGVPDSASELWVVNSKNVNAPWVKKFLTAIQQGTKYLKAHPESTWRAFAKNHPELNNKFNHEAWLGTYHYFADNPFVYNPASYNHFAKFMQQQKLIKTIPPIKDYAVGEAK